MKITKITAIAELNGKIRDLINHPRKLQELLQDTNTWYMLCSCLDAIGDTELALDAFLMQCNAGDNGKNYLLIYGALQALIIQQDAVTQMADALKVKYTQNGLLKQIREIRNDSSGHLTKRGYKKFKGGSSNRIMRMSLNQHKFVLVKNFPDGHTECVDVDVNDLINTQRSNLTETLTGIVTKLNEDEMSDRPQDTP